MTDREPSAPTRWSTAAMQRRVRRRRAAERRFRLAGLAAVVLSGAFLAFLLLTIAAQGIGGFRQTEVRLRLGPLQPPATLEAAVDRAGGDIAADPAWLAVRDAARRNPALLARAADYWVPAATAIDQAYRGAGTPAAERAVDVLAAHGAIRSRFAWGFLARADATDPVRVGIGGALAGSLWTMAVTFVLAVPIGTLAALYLEEYAPRNRWTDLIEVSINNLAAVPSILFGLLGLAVFLGTLGLPRSAPLVGGLTLALMTMPVIVIAGRGAMRAVPPSVRDAALAIGASRVQVVFHHVLPLALPGILTGTIIGMARALGETAPLLLIGMRAFIAAPPGGPSDPATVLPVQIFLWSDEVGRGFVEKTSAAILVLLAVLLAMNGTAAWLRDRVEARR